MGLLYVIHVLEQDEDLFGVAELYYGDASTWWIIYHANLELIGDDPEVLHPGLELRIPYLETSREAVEMPGFIPATAFEASKDPLVQFAEDRFNDITVSFDIREANELAGDTVIAAGTKLALPPRGDPQKLRLAVYWREQFHRSDR